MYRSKKDRLLLAEKTLGISHYLPQLLSKSMQETTNKDSPYFQESLSQVSKFILDLLGHCLVCSLSPVTPILCSNSTKSQPVSQKWLFFFSKKIKSFSLESTGNALQPDCSNDWQPFFVLIIFFWNNGQNPSFSKSSKLLQ